MQPPEKNGTGQSVTAVMRCRAADILSLRYAVLRPEGPYADIVFAQDEQEDAVHWAAYNEDGAVIGCLSLLPDPHPSGGPWRLRAMAVHPDWQRKGLGSAIMQTCAQYMYDSGETGPVWCNARCDAAEFYRKHGFIPCSEPFDNGGAGLSVMLSRRYDGQEENR